MQIECPECSKMISDKADMCPHCGYPMGKIKKEAKKKEETKSAIGWTITCFLVIVLYIAFGKPAFDTPQKPHEPDDTEAFVMSQSFVEQRLVSPTTAKFPYIGDAYEVTKIDSVTWRIHSYVDSQNRFGAMVRTSYKAKLMYVGNEKWKLLDIKIYE